MHYFLCPKTWQPMLFYINTESQNQFFGKGCTNKSSLSFHISFPSDSSHLSKLLLSVCSLKCLVREELVLNLYQVLVIRGEIQIVRIVWTLSQRNIQPGCRTRHVAVKLKDTPKATIKCKIRHFLLLSYIFMLSLWFCSAILLVHSEFTEILNEHCYK